MMRLCVGAVEVKQQKREGKLKQDQKTSIYVRVVHTSDGGFLISGLQSRATQA
jgi:aromatic ring hydroxylase